MKSTAPLVASCAILAACAGSGGPSPVDGPVSIQSVTFEMSSDANARWPARVALVQAENPDLADQLLAIPAAEWFGGKGAAFEAAHPEVYFDSWEVVPGHIAGPYSLDVDEYVSAVLFCDTDAATPPTLIAYDGDVAVHIDPEGCTVHPIP